MVLSAMVLMSYEKNPTKGNGCVRLRVVVFCPFCALSLELNVLEYIYGQRLNTVAHSRRYLLLEYIEFLKIIPRINLLQRNKKIGRVSPLSACYLI